MELTNEHIDTIYKLSEIHFNYLIRMEYDIEFKDVLKLTHQKIIDIQTAYDNKYDFNIALTEMINDYDNKYT